MAAVFLHNSLFAGPVPSLHAQHARNLSASSSDAHTVLSAYFPPGGPSASYLDLIARQQDYQRTSEDWAPGTPLRLDGDPPTHEEISWKKQRRRSQEIRTWEVLKSITYLVISTWNSYAIVRYFLGFAHAADDVVHWRIALASGLMTLLGTLFLWTEWLLSFLVRRLCHPLFTRDSLRGVPLAEATPAPFELDRVLPASALLYSTSQCSARQSGPG